MTDKQARAIFELFKPYLKQPDQRITKNAGVYYTAYGKKTALGATESIKSAYLKASAL